MPADASWRLIVLEIIGNIWIKRVINHFDHQFPPSQDAVTAADLSNDRVVPIFDEKEVKLSRVLTDRAKGNLWFHYERAKSSGRCDIAAQTQWKRATGEKRNWTF